MYNFPPRQFSAGEYGGKPQSYRQRFINSIISVISAVTNIMALYYHLPVYKASYDLLVEIFQFTKNFSREYKYTIGQDLKKQTTEMILNIYRANSTTNKSEVIQKARENIEVISLFMRLLKDLKQVNIKKFVQINELIESVSKQLTAWQKSNR